MSPRRVWSAVYLQNIRGTFSQARFSSILFSGSQRLSGCEGDYRSLQGACYRGTSEPNEQRAFVLIDLRGSSLSDSQLSLQTAVSGQGAGCKACSAFPRCEQIADNVAWSSAYLQHRFV